MDNFVSFILIVPLSSLLKNSLRVYLDWWQNKKISHYTTFFIFSDALFPYKLKIIEKQHPTYASYGKFNVKYKIDWKLTGPELRYKGDFIHWLLMIEATDYSNPMGDLKFCQDNLQIWIIKDVLHYQYILFYQKWDQDKFG